MWVRIPPGARDGRELARDDVVAGHVALHDAGQDPTFATASQAAAVGDVLVAVGRLFVDPGHRGRGVGGRLLDRATAAAHEGGQRPFLGVVRTLGPAVALYEGASWRDVGPLTVHFDGERRLDMLVFLGPPP